MRKGISPLVAVVMLIAFTLLVAGLLGGFVTQFAQEQRAQVQYCTGARILILSGVSSNGNVILSLQNFGDVELSFSVLQTFNNETVSKRSETITLDANSVEQLTLNSVDISTTKEFTVQSDECAGARDTIRSQNIKTIS